MAKYLAVAWSASHVAYNQYSKTDRGYAERDTPEEAAKAALWAAVKDCDDGPESIEDLVDLRLEEWNGFMLIFDASPHGSNDGPEYPIGVVRQSS
jgi:hypothetical protein